MQNNFHLYIITTEGTKRKISVAELSKQDNKHARLMEECRGKAIPLSLKLRIEVHFFVHASQDLHGTSVLSFLNAKKKVCSNPYIDT